MACPIAGSSVRSCSPASACWFLMLISFSPWETAPMAAELTGSDTVPPVALRDGKKPLRPCCRAVPRADDAPCEEAARAKPQSFSTPFSTMGFPSRVIVVPGRETLIEYGTELSPPAQILPPVPTLTEPAGTQLPILLDG